MDKVYDASVINVEALSQREKRLTFQLARPFSFKAGQYVWVELNQNQVIDPKGSRRAFSIISLPNDKNTISILSRDTGSGYKQVLHNLAIGSRLRIHGPFGSVFTIKQQGMQNIIMIAGGTGISPFIPIINQIIAANLPIKCYLIYLNREWAGAVLLNELDELGSHSSSFSYKAKYGYFDWADVADKYAEFGANTQFWISGPQGLSTLSSQILSGHGIAPQQMIFEAHYPQKTDDLISMNIIDSSSRYGEMLSMEDAIEAFTSHTILTDSNGVVILANKAAIKTTGYSREEIIGSTPRLWGGMMGDDFYVDFWHKISLGESFDGELINRRKNGEMYYVIAHISPLFNRERKLIGFFDTEDDITPIKTQQIALERSEQRLKLATDSAGIGFWSENIAKHELIWDDKTYELYGVNRKDSSDTLATHSQRLHPDDRMHVDEVTQQALKGSGDLDITFRILKPSGEIRFIESHAKVTRDAAGKPIEMIGANWDVTTQKNIDIAKTELISLASHQLRTPLTAMRWYLELLSSTPQNEEGKRYTKVVYDSALRMIDLVNALLNVSRVEMEPLAVNPEPINLVDLAKSTVEELKPQISAGNIKFTEFYGEGLQAYIADPKLMEVILSNVLSNAIQYTNSGGTVSLRVELMTAGDTIGEKSLSQDSLMISVADSGIGIPASQQGNLFSKLYRADNARKSRAEGSGLGLYLVKKIIDQSNGYIWFKSIENEGTTFFITLPASGMKKKEGSKNLINS